MTTKLLQSKVLTKNDSKMIISIPNAPRSGAICICFVFVFDYCVCYCWIIFWSILKNCKNSLLGHFLMIFGILEKSWFHHGFEFTTASRASATHSESKVYSSFADINLFHYILFFFVVFVFKLKRCLLMFRRISFFFVSTRHKFVFLRRPLLTPAS